MAHDKQLHRTEALRLQGRWEHRETTRVAGRRALVVGTGGIGRATARLLRAVGLDVRGAGRRTRDDDEDFGTVVDSARLGEHLGGVDHLVMVAPLTGATRGMRGADELARSEEHTSELQSRFDLVCRLLLERKKKSRNQGTQHK